MKKHAYLIMAHNDFYTLEKLLCLIDDERNDIYIHIDKKVKGDISYLKSVVKKSEIHLVKRMDVRWGDISQIECEIILLKEATLKYHKYYHLISGVDLPLKTQNEFHNFFDDKNLEFIDFDNFDKISEKHLNRLKHYHLFTKHLRSKNKTLSYICSSFRFRFEILQSKLNINRLKKTELIFQKGANWFSITHNFAKYCLEHLEYLKYFKYSYCADELFLQTIIINSPFKNKIFKKNGVPFNGRFIDWNRGNPYIFQKKDLKELLNSDSFFARKFSSKTDQEIIDAIYNKLKKE